MSSIRPVVIDASVALALLLEEPEAPEVARAVRSWTLAGRARIVPSHFWLEVVNRLGRAPDPSGQRTLAAIHRLDALGLRTINEDRGTLILAIDRVERYGLTAYDALYLALAESLQADLATFDRALAAAAGPRAITFDEGHRLHEPPAAYEHDVKWPNYKLASAYLSKLRAEALAGR